MIRSVSKTYNRFNNFFLYYVPCRTAKFELPFKWERPEKVPIYKPEKAGDLKPFKGIDLKKFPGLFQKSEELKTADDNVKRLFTLEFHKGDVVRKEMKNEYKELVKRHQWDNSSPEAKIAALTAIIRYLQDVMDGYKDKKAPLKTRIYIKELVEKRAKHLRILRKKDYKLFEWLIEKLDLVHKPIPTPNPEKVERKKSLRRLTDLYCESLRQERLDQYREYLESQQEEFLQKKLETYQWIQNKEKEYGINLTVTDEDISNLTKQLEEIKSKKKVVVEN